VGFFRKPAQTQPPKPAIGLPDPAQLRQAGELMAQFTGAAGRDGAHRVLAEGLCSVAGLTGGDAPAARGEQDPAAAWRWLLAVASEAEQRGNHALPARIFATAFFWNMSVAPQLTAAETRELGLPGAPRDIEARLATVALPCLLAVPADRVVMRCPGGELTAGHLALIAAQKLSNVAGADPVVTPRLLGLGQDVLAGKVAHAGPDAADS
jgi:hypothetical protein